MMNEKQKNQERGFTMACVILILPAKNERVMKASCQMCGFGTESECLLVKAIPVLSREIQDQTDPSKGLADLEHTEDVDCPVRE
jgi:hypothetical protein